MAFVVAERGEGEARSRTPIGTAFVIRHESPAVEGLGLEYVVTASHVVGGGEQTWVRFRTRDGGVKDLPAEDWVRHPKADVALSPLRHDDPDLHLLNIPVSILIGTAATEAIEPQLGDRVYYLGLFARQRSMREGNVPLVRVGALGAREVEDVRLTLPDEAVRVIPRAHLIDCRSYGGFSGAPCFVQQDGAVSVLGGMRLGPQTALIGLLSGHFDDEADAKVTGDVLGTIRTKINTGVGVVTPSEHILEVLAMEEIVEDRERIEREERERRDDDGAATADSVPPDPEPDYTRDQFLGDLKRATQRLDEKPPKA